METNAKVEVHNSNHSEIHLHVFSNSGGPYSCKMGATDGVSHKMAAMGGSQPQNSKPVATDSIQLPITTNLVILQQLK